MVSFDCLPSSLFHPDVLSCRWWNLAPSCPLDYTRPDPMGQDLATRLLVSRPALLGSRRVARTSRYSSTSMTCLLESSESSCLTDPVIPPCHTAMACGFFRLQQHGSQGGRKCGEVVTHEGELFAAFHGRVMTYLGFLQQLHTRLIGN